VAEIFDVTKYLDDHPGGGEILVDSSGKDATNMFVSIGHSESAYETMEGLKIGVLKMSVEEKRAKEDARKAAAERAAAGGLGVTHILALLIVILIGVVMSNEEYKAQVMTLMGKN
jgi:cytochrome-b5 reductase